MSILAASVTTQVVLYGQKLFRIEELKEFYVKEEKNK
jgi:hypothetical protein